MTSLKLMVPNRSPSRLSSHQRLVRTPCWVLTSCSRCNTFSSDALCSQLSHAMTRVISKKQLKATITIFNRTKEETLDTASKIRQKCCRLTLILTNLPLSCSSTSRMCSEAFTAVLRRNLRIIEGLSGTLISISMEHWVSKSSSKAASFQE